MLMREGADVWATIRLPTGCRTGHPGSEVGGERVRARNEQRCIVLLTEWNEFKHLTLRAFALRCVYRFRRWTQRL